MWEHILNTLLIRILQIDLQLHLAEKLLPVATCLKVIRVDIEYSTVIKTGVGEYINYMIVLLY